MEAEVGANREDVHHQEVRDDERVEMAEKQNSQEETLKRIEETKGRL